MCSDEAHFTLDGAVNSQNCRYGVVNVLMLCMSVLCIRVTLQYCVVLQQILFLVLFFRAENFSRSPEVFYLHVIVNSINSTSFPLYVNDSAYRLMCLCKIGAPPHVARQVTAMLRAHFGDEHIISWGFPTAWPPRSPDLNPCDF